MAAAELTFDVSLGIPQAAGTKGINEWMEVQGAPEIEVVQVFADSSGDWFYSRKFQKIKAVMVQSHGATFSAGTGTSLDPPKVVVTQGTATGANAKVTISKSAANESLSFIIFGEM